MTYTHTHTYYLHTHTHTHTHTYIRKMIIISSISTITHNLYYILYILQFHIIIIIIIY